MNRRIACLLVGLALLCAAPAARAEMDEAARARMVEQLRAHHILPRHDQLAARARDLTRYVASFCHLSDEAHLTAAREAFEEAYLAFMGIQHIRFGPALEDDRHYRLQFWPDKHNQGSRQLRELIASSDPVPDAAALAEMSVAVQGFPALERVLFAGGPDAFAGEAGARRCQLASVIAENIKKVTGDLFIAWFEYHPQDGQELIDGLFDGVLEQFATITELKLKRPLGTDGKVRPKRSEAWRSTLSYAAIRANLFALKGALIGEYEMPGLSAALSDAPSTQDIRGAVEEHLDYALRIIDERPAPLAEDLETDDGRQFLQFLIHHLDDARDFVLEIYPDALGVITGFNALDGD